MSELKKMSLRKALVQTLSEILKVSGICCQIESSYFGFHPHTVYGVRM